MAVHVSLTLQIMRSEIGRVGGSAWKPTAPEERMLMAQQNLVLKQLTRTGVSFYFSTIDRRVLSVPVACMVRRSGVPKSTSY